jgi:3-mercaptopyruvate sulfurtransferase SseA/sterol desaturase/sphingolipid hydroxylase (fatty acid hydroxylase superfamily)
MNWTKWIVAVFLCGHFGLTHSFAQPLIEAEELHRLLKEEANVRLIDVRTADAYDEGHIPGAIQLWRSDFSDALLPYSGMLIPRSAFAALLSRLGISAEDTLILTDDRGGCNAARLWWALDYYGHPHIRLLNGGYAFWEKSGYPTSTNSVSLPTTNYEFFGPPKTDRIATLDQVKRAASNEATIVLLDTRSKEEYEGKTQAKKAFRKGHIPGSIHVDWEHCLNQNDEQRLLSVKDLEAIYRPLLPDLNQAIIVYCQSGARSAHTTFVLTQLLGYTNVRNYDGSWAEWSFHDELPIESDTPIEPRYEAGTNYWTLIKESYSNYANYLWYEITHPSWHNYFYWLLLVSLIFFLVELLFPWRKSQATFRKDFWLDFFYMFFNFFLFSLIVYNAASDVVVTAFHNGLKAIGINNLVALEVQTWPIWAHLALGFVVRDFVQWWIHRLLHRVPFLWEFHKVHHSVEQMGFAAHLRYHWMENVVYRTLEYIPLALIGIGLNDFFIIHIFALTVGHWNHSNFKLNIGPLKFLLNNPQMHIWHHAHDLPKEHPYGVNFGLTLSIWDYLFGTNYIPHDGRDIRLGFPGVETFPQDFLEQNTHGILPGEKKNQSNQ